MKTNLYCLISCAAVMAMMPSCSQDDDGTQSAPYKTSPTIELSRSEATVNAGVNDFGLIFFNEVAKVSEEDNLCVSPVSMGLCMSIIANSCDASTAAKVCEVLGCGSISDVNNLSKKLMLYLPDKSNQSQLQLANSVWHRNEIAASPDFKTRISEYYFGHVEGVNFKDASDLSKIEAWINANSKVDVHEFVNSLDANTLLLCLNTLTFHDSWKNKFDAVKNVSATFYGKSDNATVTMMKNSLDTRYYESDTWQCAVLDYQGNNEMIVVAPKGDCDIDQLATTFGPSDLQLADERFGTVDLRLTMPKFEVATTISCNEALANMGINLTTSNLEHFSGEISSSDVDPMNISYNQQTVLSVDESGTTASTVSSGTVGDTAIAGSRTVTLTLDSPFVYLIRNKTTKSILLAGVFAQP